MRNLISKKIIIFFSYLLSHLPSCLLCYFSSFSSLLCSLFSPLLSSLISSLLHVSSLYRQLRCISRGHNTGGHLSGQSRRLLVPLLSSLSWRIPRAHRGSLSLPLSLCLSLCLPLSHPLSICLSLCLSVSLSPSVCLSVCQSVCLSLTLSFYFVLFIVFLERLFIHNVTCSFSCITSYHTKLHTLNYTKLHHIGSLQRRQQEDEQ